MGGRSSLGSPLVTNRGLQCFVSHFASQTLVFRLSVARSTLSVKNTASHLLICERTVKKIRKRNCDGEFLPRKRGRPRIEKDAEKQALRDALAVTGRWTAVSLSKEVLGVTGTELSHRQVTRSGLTPSPTIQCSSILSPHP